MRYGPIAEPNPWGATGLEWTTSSPPPTVRLAQIPVVTEEAYAYGLRAGSVTEPEARAHPAGMAHQFEDLDQQHEADTLGIWVFLITEIMFFGGVFAAMPFTAGCIL